MITQLEGEELKFKPAALLISSAGILRQRHRLPTHRHNRQRLGPLFPCPLLLVHIRLYLCSVHHRPRHVLRRQSSNRLGQRRIGYDRGQRVVYARSVGVARLCWLFLRARIGGEEEEAESAETRETTTLPTEREALCSSSGTSVECVRGEGGQRAAEIEQRSRRQEK
jgi:hypothetical protein